MKQMIKRLLCRHSYKEITVYLGDDELVEQCTDCGRRRLRDLR